MLSKALESFFSVATRARGEAYFKGVRVTVERLDDREFDASVRGGERYDVQLVRDSETTVLGRCTCPYATDGHPCKHLWATILLAQAQGWGTSRTSPSSFELSLGALIGGGGEAPLPGDDDEPPEARVIPWTPPRPPVRREPTWRDLIAGVPMPGVASRAPRHRPGREALFVVDAPMTAAGGMLIVEIGWRDRKVNGEWGVPRTKAWLHDELAGATTPEDDRALELLAGVADAGHYLFERGSFGTRSNVVRIAPALVDVVCPAVCATGHAWARDSAGILASRPLQWDSGPPWELVLLVRSEGDGRLVMEHEIRRGGDRLTPQDVLATTRRLLVTTSQLARLDTHGAHELLRVLERNGRLVVPAADVPAFLNEALARSGDVRVDLPPELGIEERTVPPRPELYLRTSGAPAAAPFAAEVTFDYDGLVVPSSSPVRRLLAERRLVHRDRAAEADALRQLVAAGARGDPGGEGFLVPLPRLVELVRALTAAGWHVEADGRAYRFATSTRARVSSGIDWFDLDGVVEFGDQSVPVATVVDALARGARGVTLDDGSVGLLPEDWLADVVEWAGLAERQGSALRFRRGQAALLDALLAAAPVVDVDAAFDRARRALREFEGVGPADPPASFRGVLRPYQREGLGWIRFLARLGFGGCLADDMGLGKTVQVLAALTDRRAAGLSDTPSLIVVPRSLVFNWMREAARFAPRLRVADRTTAGRERIGDDLREIDLVIATYGTVRRDAVKLSAVEFDYLVLDEAHAIKNVDSQTAKAVRLLRGRHRLALTGTPVQNHPGELWSLFDFLNPGLLGRSRTFAALAKRTTTDAGARALLARAVRPYVLRRTKAEVARDLPERTEETIVCRLAPDERRFYDELRAYYRRAVGERLQGQGWAGSQLFVLEALLRLRQAACHPGLVDERRREAGSAKLDVLLAHLAELRDEGHKAIVFSQFVQLLALVRAALDREGVAYEYLDGQTRDRDRRVDRFQQDAGCGLFLVSLKAGGVGLNLTAAEYVFLLDPWWNPAIEAQAIDRAHRIGQTRRVFAYRLIAEDTIDEKVIELQARKRELADGLLGGEPGGLASLTREDLELLLS